MTPISLTKRSQLASTKSFNMFDCDYYNAKQLISHYQGSQQGRFKKDENSISMIAICDNYLKGTWLFPDIDLVESQNLENFCQKYSSQITKDDFLLEVKNHLLKSQNRYYSKKLRIPSIFELSTLFTKEQNKDFSYLNDHFGSFGYQFWASNKATQFSDCRWFIDFSENGFYSISMAPGTFCKSVLFFKPN